ncbi:hypothetical protein [Micromonospora sp. NPDC005979]|uniref:hypothetical protein n=1 Tax=Micromonospora sp. NPDC005979 TaxID=3156726 RepID=UPI0033B519BA
MVVANQAVIPRPELASGRIQRRLARTGNPAVGSWPWRAAPATAWSAVAMSGVFTPSGPNHIPPTYAEALISLT